MRPSATFRVIIFYLRAIGLWPSPREPHLFLYKISAIFKLFFGMTLDTIFVALNMVAIWGDIDKMATCSFVLLIKAVAVVKAALFAKDFQLIFETIESLDQEEFRPKNANQARFLDNSLKQWKLSYNTFFISAFVTLLFWYTFPVMDGTIHEYRLPFAAWYPFEYRKYPMYQVMYAHQCLCTIYTSLVNVNLDGFFAGLMAHVTVQCNLLKDNLAHISVKRGQPDQQFHDCIIHHHKILKLTERVNKIVNLNASAQFFSSVVLICTTLLHVTLIRPGSMEFFTSLTYLSCIFLQLLTYCWFGDQVTVQSSEIPMHAFLTDWVDASNAYKKKLSFFIFCTQKPIKIYALNFFALSVATFTTILRTSWSYFVLLRNLQNQQL